VIRPAAIATPRLALVPAPSEIVRAVLAGDLSTLAHADGWPHADTLDAMRVAPAIWLVALDSVVIGECGTVGQIDDAGDVEIGYGLAAEHRGLGYGTELVHALSQWLLRQQRVARVLAAAEAGNAPSRRALERAGFVLERSEGDRVWYALAGDSA
jgi:RimJ/RimL family protein N-acetyltransferase